ncbi:hypothetical protein GCM10025867_04190 [Frondihabitans sucicola]|uniref:Uncharacterized protein n=1 Tax=Frondihabitans sucicola TaxID=1268041 RepID=A0ABN6XTC9_9MICO|nr:hypothetical protein GCM10025867_04190 [Frondihabitans sucicola]
MGDEELDEAEDRLETRRSDDAVAERLRVFRRELRHDDDQEAREAADATDQAGAVGIRDGRRHQGAGEEGHAERQDRSPSRRLRAR